MTLHRIDPLRDPRWGELAQRHPRACVFHTPGWLEALRRTYRYEPVVLATSGPSQELRNGIVLCQIDSLLTGRRLVSLPFADHCEPLVDSPGELETILVSLQQDFQDGKWKYIEIRPRGPGWAPETAFARSGTFYLHTLDLRPTAEQLLHSFAKSSVQRVIHRAEREGLAYEDGRSEALLDKFYRLFLLTRRRHQLPPPPRDWFRNLMACLGESFKIRVASKAGRPIASIITLRHKHMLVYKYGCSDQSFHNLGGVAFLFWRTILEAKQEGLQEFDFGRSDCDNSGLVTYKDHWGSTRSTLTYLRYPAPTPQTTFQKYGTRLASHVFAHAPDGILRLVGELLYKHVG